MSDNKYDVSPSLSAVRARADETEPTVTRDEFLSDAASVLRRSETEGPIVVLGRDGKPSSIVHSPKHDSDTCEGGPCCTDGDVDAGNGALEAKLESTEEEYRAFRTDARRELQDQADLLDAARAVNARLIEASRHERAIIGEYMAKSRDWRDEKAGLEGELAEAKEPWPMAIARASEAACDARGVKELRSVNTFLAHERDTARQELAEALAPLERQENMYETEVERAAFDIGMHHGERVSRRSRRELTEARAEVERLKGREAEILALRQAWDEWATRNVTAARTGDHWWELERAIRKLLEEVGQ